MADVAQIVALARLYQDRQVAMSARVSAAAGRVWDQLAPIGNTEAAEWIDTIVSIMGAAETQAASLAAGYIATYATLAGDTTDVEAFDPFDPAALRNGVDPELVYMRPVVTTRQALAGDKQRSAALAAGRARALQIVDTDMGLAARQGSTNAIRARSSIVGYRRVPDARACKFCLLVSTQRYKRGDLMPLHPHCHCVVAPIIGMVDPGHVLDKDLLKRLKAEGVVDDITRQRQAERAIERAAKTDVAVHEHGELGPVLTPAGQRFTGPDDLAA